MIHMKRLVLICVVWVTLVFQSAGQNNKSSWFDFWIGKWNVSWDEGDGKMGSGTNNVIRILDGKVIQENFSVNEGSSKGYLGTSLSVFNPNSNQWHQGYADNQGVYYNFIGDREGSKYLFKTLPIETDNKIIIQRMMFYNISHDSLTWDWESTQDGGKSWKLNWRVSYHRVVGSD